VLTVLALDDLKAKCAKWTQASPKVNYWGIDIDWDGIHAQEHKTGVVMDWTEPENSKDVRGFLGRTSYYRRFIEHYAHIAMPLDTITTALEEKGNVVWERGEPRRVTHTAYSSDRECHYDFNTPKKALGNALVHALPDPEAKFSLHHHQKTFPSG
jgi:hypothetical protein